jgi:RNA polymerase sigma factor (sigma-70 family)
MIDNDYLNAIGRYPLLTAAQEIELARQVQRGLADDATPREQRRGKRAQDRIVCCNLRLVVSVAKTYTARCSSFTIEDLIQLGSIGLAHATTKFDPERGYKFSTYARDWIVSYIRRGIINGDSIIRLPDQQYWKMVKYRTGESRPDASLECAILLAAGARAVSLNTPVVGDDERSSELQDIIAAEHIEDNYERKAVVRDVIARLPYNEQQVLILHYGLGSETVKGERRLSQRLGISIHSARMAFRKGRQRLADNPALRELCGLSCDKSEGNGNVKGSECSPGILSSGKR